MAIVYSHLASPVGPLLVAVAEDGVHTIVARYLAPTGARATIP
jgi:hypothetical protein